MAASGARVLQLRSVEYARNHGIRDPLPQLIRGRPRYPRARRGRDDGTTARDRRHALRGEARVTLTGVRDEPGIAGRIFGALADANVNVDMIIQNEPVCATTRPTSRSPSAVTTCPPARRWAPSGARQGVLTDERIGKVSIVGADAQPPRRRRQGLRDPGARNGINIEMISVPPSRSPRDRPWRRRRGASACRRRRSRPCRSARRCGP